MAERFFRDTSELPEFLRFNKYGGVLTTEERKRVAETRGVCITCGRSTHKVTPFRTTPLDNENVFKGICLICHPEERVLDATQSSRNGMHNINPNDMGAKAARLMGTGKSIDARRASINIRAGDNPNESSPPRVETLRKWKSNPYNELPLTFPSMEPRHSNGREGQIKDLSESLTRNLSASTSDVWDLLGEMRSNPDDVTILTRKCHELRSVGTNQAGSLYEIIDVMIRYPREGQLQFAAIGALWSLIADGEDDRIVEALDAGAAKTIMNAMRNIPGDPDLIAWGMGALCSIAEGVGGRTELQNQRILEEIETVLSNYHTFNSGNVIYWTLRCLETLVAFKQTTEDDADDGDNDDSSDAIQDLDAARRYRETITNYGILHYVISAMSNHSTDAVTLEVGFKFLEHLPSESLTDENQKLLLDICGEASKASPSASFQTLHIRSCAFLSTILNNNPTMRSHVLNKPSEWLWSFIGIALGTLASYNDDDVVVRDIMTFTLSHILCSDNVEVSGSECKRTLKICVALMKGHASVFLQESCCWIIWRVLSRCQSSTISTKLASQITEVIKGIISGNANRPRLLTVGFAAFSEASLLYDVAANPLAEVVIYLAKLNDDQILQSEACRLLGNLCSTESDATYILSEGGSTLLELTMCCTPVIHRLGAIHLMYRICLTAEDKVFPVGCLERVIDTWCQSVNGCSFAAQVICILATSATADNGDFAFVASIELEFIATVITNSNHKSLQHYACLALRNLASTAQTVNVQLDVSYAIAAVLKLQKDCGAPLHKVTCDAIWALLAVDSEPALLKDITQSTICVVSQYVNSGENFRGDILATGFAIFSVILGISTNLQILGLEIAEQVIVLVVNAIYECLDRDGSQSSIFWHGLSVLQCCAIDDFCKSKIVAHGGIVATVDTMVALPENSSIQMKCCNLLRLLAAGDVETRMCIVEADGADAIINVLVNHCEDVKLLPEAFLTLACVSINKRSREFVAQIGGFMLMTSAMNSLMSSTEVLESGLEALSLLASDASESVLDACGILETIRAALENHPVEFTIQKNGLTLLNNLSRRNESIRGKIVASGCLDSIFMAITVHTRNEKVVSTSISILSHLSSKAECLRLLLEKEVLDLITRAMMINIRCRATQMNGCYLLCVLNADNKITSGVSGVEALLSAMLYHYDSEKIADYGVRVLSGSALQENMNQLSLLNAQIMKAILSAMDNFPRSVLVQSNSMIALRNCTAHAEFVTALQPHSSRVVSAINNAVSNFPECVERAHAIMERIQCSIAVTSV
eukprot:scaffold4621_cov194-Alexandrium_tamarense.AAC.6